MGKEEFKDYTTEQLEETLKCLNFLRNMEFNQDYLFNNGEEVAFYSSVEQELKVRSEKR